MSPKLLIGLASALAATSASTPPKFAIICDGTVRDVKIPDSRLFGAVQTSRNSKQTYVFDRSNKTVQRALQPLQRFEDVCGVAGARQTVDFANSYIRADSTVPGNGDKCRFVYDLRTHEAQWSLRWDGPDGRYSEWNWIMNCKKTAIPVFDAPKQ